MSTFRISFHLGYYNLHNGVDNLKDSSLKFVVSSREQRVKAQLNFPYYYANVLTAPDVSLLVLCVTNNGNIVGGCSLSGKFHMAVLYIKEGYRRKGIATRLFLETIRIAREQGINFLTGAVPPWHIAALRMDFKVGFKVVKHFKDFILIIRPLNFKGEILYAFLRTAFSLLPDSMLTKTYSIAVRVLRECGQA